MNLRPPSRAAATIIGHGRRLSGAALRAAQRGMTLIELMVVMAIVALLMVVGAASVSAISGADAEASGSVLSGAMTYLASRAVHDNKTYRLIIDMDARRFWSETTNEDDPCSRFIPDDPEAGLNPEAEDAKTTLKAKAKDEEAEAAAAKGPNFVQKKEGNLLQRSFAKDTNVSSILTAHHTEPQVSGRAAIYFYPNGQAERALVWVGVADTSVATGWRPELTIEMHSLGTVTFHSKPVDERDFDLSRAEEVQ